MNRFREWLSDNLRYILLILAVALGAGAIVMGVRLYKTYQVRRQNGAATEAPAAQAGEIIIVTERPQQETPGGAQGTGSEARTPDAGPETGAQAEPESRMETAAPGPETASAEPESASGTAAEPETESERASEPEPESTSETAAEPETESERASEPETESERASETAAEPETESESTSETAAEPESESEGALQTAEPGSASETLSEPESEEETAETGSGGEDVQIHNGIRIIQIQPQTDTETETASGQKEAASGETETAAMTETETEPWPVNLIIERETQAGPAETTAPAGPEDHPEPPPETGAQDPGDGTSAQTEAAVTPETAAPLTETETETQRQTEEIETLENYEDPVTMYAVTSANVRSGPGTQYRIAGSLGPWEAIDVRGETTSWYQVKLDGRTGYIRKTLMTDEYTPVYLTMTGTCYMRSEADYGDNIIGEYYAGTTVEFLEDVGGWYKVRVDGKTGYMGARFFK